MFSVCISRSIYIVCDSMKEGHIAIRMCRQVRARGVYLPSRLDAVEVPIEGAPKDPHLGQAELIGGLHGSHTLNTALAPYIPPPSTYAMACCNQ